MTVNVRRMMDSDLDTVYAIETESHITPWSREVLRDCVYVGYDCVVLELQEEGSSTIIGYLIARHSESMCHILNLCIAKSWQGKGHGRNLMTSYLATLEINERVETAMLEVRPSNLIAIHLYTSLGFKKISIKENYYNDVDGTEDAIVLKKQIIH